jgi:protein phosphatase 1 regulatory subunit 3A/B/C/D/E
MEKTRQISGNSVDSGICSQFDTEPHHRLMPNPSSSFISSEPATPLSDKHSDITKFRYQRSSSLKTRRTPPGTPANKAVRFADAFGLDLTTVKHIFNTDCPPTVPASAKKHLNCSEYEDASDGDEIGMDRESRRMRLSMCLHPCFPQPGDNPNFMKRVLDQNVCLERVSLSDSGTHLLKGTVRVKNLCYHKKVAIRVTYNDWRSFTDIPATYVNSPDGGLTDCFAFQVFLTLDLLEDQRLQFAIQYKTDQDEEFWDNSFGKNYVLMRMDLIKNPSS